MHAVPVAYYTGVANVGDLANADIVSLIGAGQPYQTRETGDAHLLAIGSNMHWSTPNSLVWGTGIMHPEFGIGGVRKTNVHALRGKLTASRLAAEGLGKDVALGDPAWLLPGLLGTTTGRPQPFVGLAAHYADKNDRRIQTLLSEGEATTLDVNTLDLPLFLEKMACCSVVISSSLHALIFAEAMGIPNLWIEVGDRVRGHGFKFHDWFSTARYPQHEAVTLNSQTLLRDLIEACTLHEMDIDSAALIASFPRSDVIREFKPPYPLIDYATCRRQPLCIFVDASQSFPRSSLERTVYSAKQIWPAVRVVLAGPHAASIDLNNDIMHTVHTDCEASGINDAFLKRHFDCWAEPQRHAVAQLGFDFSKLAKSPNIDQLLSDVPELAEMIIDSEGYRLIYRRAGRWW